MIRLLITDCGSVKYHKFGEHPHFFSEEKKMNEPIPVSLITKHHKTLSLPYQYVVPGRIILNSFTRFVATSISSQYKQ